MKTRPAWKTPVLVWAVLAAACGACSLLRVAEWDYPCAAPGDCSVGYTCVEQVCRVRCDGAAGCAPGHTCTGAGCVPGGAGSSGVVSLSSGPNPSTSAGPAGSSSSGSSSATTATSAGSMASSQVAPSSSAALPPPQLASGTIIVDEGVAGQVLLAVAPVALGTTVELVDPPAGGTVDLSLVGTNVAAGYTPLAGWLGGDRFTLRARSPSGAPGNVATVTVHVVSRRSCAWVQLTAANPTAQQTLDPDGTGALPAYNTLCDFTADGGGWTLAFKVDGNARNFNFDAAHWTSATGFQEQQANTNETETKTAAAWTVPVGWLRVDMRAAGAPVPLRLNSRVASPSPLAPATATLRDLMAGTTLATTFAGRTSWEGLVPGAVVRDGCLQEGVNNNPNTTNTLVVRVRLGLLGNNESHCGSPDSVVGVGINHPSCSGGNAPAAGHYMCSGGSANTPAFAWVWVRDDDFTRLPTALDCAAHRALGRSLPGFYRTGVAPGTVAWCP